MEQVIDSKLKIGSIGNWLGLVLFTIRNRFFGWIFFLPEFILSLVSMFTSAAIFYLMGQVVAKGAEAHVSQYGLDYGSYIVTGVMFSMVMQMTLQGYHLLYLNGYWANQLDMYLQFPGGISSYLVGGIVYDYFLVMLNTGIYLLVGRWLFHIPVAASNLLDVLIILILAVTALTGLGLAGASTFTLLNAKGWGPSPVEWLMGFGATLLSGVYFPPTVLPGWLQWIGEWLPQTHVLRAARLCLSGEATLSSSLVVYNILYLLKFTMLALPIGILLFAVGMRQAQRKGSLTKWS